MLPYRPLLHLRRAVLALALLPLLGACASGRSDSPARPVLLGLPGVVDSIISTEPLDRTHWGVAAYDPVADRMLLRINYGKHFIPASNTKLVVTAAGLALLEPSFRYETPIYAADVRGETAQRLVLVASGDPTLSFRFHERPLGAIEALADSVARAGIRRVTGPLIIDTRVFDDQLLHPAWEVGDLDWRYAAPVDAFAVDEATVSVVIAPGRTAGEPAVLDVLAPAGVLDVENELLTDTAYARFAWGYLRRADGSGFTFEGNVPLQSDPDTVQVPVFRPAEYAGQALLAELERRGVTVEGGLRLVTEGEDMLAAVDAPGMRLLSTWRSPPLSDIVAEILKPSNNWVAEQLLKTLGARFGEEGSWREGIRVETDWLVNTVGVDSMAFRLRDGSGLSAQNLLSPQAIIDLLRYAAAAEWGAVYRAALAEPGAEGTLEERLTALRGRTFAKTGTISNVNALSGFVVNELGNEVIFSILTNGTGMPASEVRPAMDRIVEAIARIGAPPLPVQPQRRADDPMAPF